MSVAGKLADYHGYRMGSYKYSKLLKTADTVSQLCMVLPTRILVLPTRINMVTNHVPHLHRT